MPNHRSTVVSVWRFQQLCNQLIKTTDKDNEQFLMKLRDRINRVGIDCPLVEVHFENLKVDAEIYISTRGLPTRSGIRLLAHWREAIVGGPTWKERLIGCEH